MLSIRRTSLKASTSTSFASSSTRAVATKAPEPDVYFTPEGKRRPKPIYPTGMHPALVSVHGLYSPRLRQARKPNQPRPQASHPYPYNLDPNLMNRQHLVDTFRAGISNPNPDPYSSRSTGRNPPTSAHYTPGAHTTVLDKFGPTTRTDAVSGETFTHSSPPMVRKPNLNRERTAPKELPYMEAKYGKKEVVERVTGHHKSTEQWNLDLAFSVRRGAFEESVKLVEEMIKNVVKCDEETLRLLVEGLDVEKVLREAEAFAQEEETSEGGQEVVKSAESSSIWIPEATLVLEVEKEDTSDLSASAANSWRSTLATIAEAERKIALHLKELALWETEDARLARTIASAPPLSDRILATTKRLLSKAAVRSRGHAVSMYHNREAALAQQVRDLEEEEDGIEGRSPEEVENLWQQHKDYNVSEWGRDVRAGWETERDIWVKVDQEIVQPRKRELQGWQRSEHAMKSRKQEIDQALKDAREVVTLAEKILVLPSGLNEDGTTASSNTPLPPAGQDILRRLLRQQSNIPSKFTSSTPSTSDLSLEDRKQAFLATSRSNLLQATHLLSRLEALERLTQVRLTPAHWKTLIGKLSSYRVSTSSLTSSASDQPTSESWKAAFNSAHQLYLARVGSAEQILRPRPGRALSISVLDALLNTVLQEKSFPLAIPTVTTILHRLLTVNEGSSLRAARKHSNPRIRTKNDLQSLEPLAVRNEPIYTLLRLVSAILSVARKDLAPGLEAKSFSLLDVDFLEDVGRLIGEPGMFDLDPVQEEGMKIEVVVEGRKMRKLVERVRWEVGQAVETVWDLREIRGTLEGERRPVREVVVEEGEEEEEEGEGEGKTDEVRREEFVEEKKKAEEVVVEAEGEKKSSSL